MESQENKNVCCTGTSQWERFPDALRKDFIGIDERNFEDLLRQAAEFARKVKYYDDDCLPAGDWTGMFSLIYDYDRQEIKEDVLCSLAESSSVPPQLSLLIAFLKMFQVEQKKLNSLVDSNLEFYYKEALGFIPKKGECGTVSVTGELVKSRKSVFIPMGTCFPAGKDSEGNDVLYENKYDVTLNGASIDSRTCSDGHSGDSFSFAFSCDLLNQKVGSCYLCLEGGISSYLSGSDITYTAADGWKTAEYITKVGLIKELRDTFGNTFNEKFPACFNNASGFLKIDTPCPCNPDVHGDAFDTADPVIRFSCNNLRGLDMPASMMIGGVDMLVLGSSEVILENPEGIMQNKKGAFPFGTLARKGSEFSISFPYKPVSEPVVSISFKENDKAIKRVFEGSRIVYTLDTDKYDQRVQSNKYALGVMASQEDDTDLSGQKKERADTLNKYRTALESSSAALTLLKDEVNQLPLNSVDEILLNAVMAVANSCDVLINEFDLSEDGEQIQSQIKKQAESIDSIRVIINDLRNYRKSMNSWINSIENSNTSVRSNIDSVIEELGGIIKENNDIQKKIDELTRIRQSIKGEIEDGPGLIPLVPELSSPVSVVMVHYHSGRLKYFSANPFRKFSLSSEQYPFRAFPVFDKNKTRYVYFEVGGINDGDHLNLYFRMTHKRTVPSGLNPEWRYLGEDDRWVPIADADILRDTTDSLKTSGVISLRFDAIPEGHYSMPSGKLWLRLDIKTLDYDAIADVLPQAFELEVSPTSVGIATPGESVPAGTVKKPQKAISGLKKVVQTYPGTTGRADENDTAFVTRVSEYLRHKGRAWTGWDYERIILEKFPEISSVKTVPLHDAEHSFQPGNVCLLVLPAADSVQDNDLCPVASAELRKKIQDYLSDKVSSQVNYHVVDPEYVEVSVAATLTLRKGYDDKQHYKNEIVDALKKFLSPWSDKNTPVTPIFGINESDILVFLEDLPCVDYVKTLSVQAGSETVNAGEDITTASPFQILASASRHFITIE